MTFLALQVHCLPCDHVYAMSCQSRFDIFVHLPADLPDACCNIYFDKTVSRWRAALTYGQINQRA